MIETVAVPGRPGAARHRVTGRIGRDEAERGAAAALAAVRELAAAGGPLDLLLDLRGMRFADLHAHKAWSEGFARNPELASLVRAVAIVGDDTAAFHAERELLMTERVRFFDELGEAEAWLAGWSRVG